MIKYNINYNKFYYNKLQSVRQSTRAQTLVHVDKQVRKETKLDLGSVRMYTFDLATRNNCTDLEFGLEKDLLLNIMCELLV